MTQTSISRCRQALRPVYCEGTLILTTPLSTIVNVEARYDSKTNENVILWDEVLIAFKNASYIRNEGTMVSFLRDDNFEVLKPLRIRANPDVVLEVVLDSTVNGSVELSWDDSGMPRSHETTREPMEGLSPHSASRNKGKGVLRGPHSPQHSSTSIIAAQDSSPSQETSLPISGGVPKGSIGGTDAYIQNRKQSSGGINNISMEKVEITAGRIDVDPTLIFERGVAYFNGDTGVPQDYSKALEKFHIAAAQNHIGAQYYLGTMYHSGKGTPQDYSKALGWYLKAANQGDASAQNNLGANYFNGTGVPRDYSKAMSWFLMAASRGSATSQNWLGTMYYNGYGAPRDYGKAKLWYEKAAEEGNAAAQTNLGAMYRDEKGVTRDYSKALSWFEKAAGQGYHIAQNWLGTMYCNGNGVPRDLTKAIELYEVSAKQGNASAQRNLEIVLREICGQANDSAGISYSNVRTN